MIALIVRVGRGGEYRHGDGAPIYTNTWQVYLSRFAVWMLLLCVSLAQFDPDGEHVCKDPKTGGFRCCDGFYPLDGTCVECAAGWYGSECSQKCECYNSARCDGVTGQCTCSDYWKGPQCTTCMVVPYMDYCRTKCLHCYNADICEPAVGDCECSVGWRGDYCDQTCEEGSYGNNCENLCNPGWQGHNCSEPCSSGHYGNECGKCPVCEHGVCDQVLGCLCHPGYTGERCTELCAENSYGGNCLYQCSCVNGGECDPVSGNCTCKASYAGTYCQLLSDSRLFEKQVRSLHVLMYVLVGILNVVLVISLILYRREVKLRMSSLVNRFKSTPLRNEDDPIEFDGVESVRTRIVSPGEAEMQVSEYHDTDDRQEESTLREYHDNEDETPGTTEYARLKEDD